MSKRAAGFVVERAVAAASRPVAFDPADAGDTARERRASRRRGATAVAVGVSAWNDRTNAPEEC